MPKNVKSDKNLAIADVPKKEKPNRHLLERIYRIRLDEMKLYKKITGFFASSQDYAPKSPETRNFFQRIQNKILWSITGLTATGLLTARSKADSPHLGLTFWYHAKINKSNVTVAKNYLEKDEILGLKRKEATFFKKAEKKAKKHPETDLAYWEKKVDKHFSVDNATFPTEDEQMKENARQQTLQNYEAFKAKLSEQMPKQTAAASKKRKKTSQP